MVRRRNWPTSPDADFVEVPGTHMSSVTKPELGQAIAEWLGRQGMNAAAPQLLLVVVGPLRFRSGDRIRRGPHRTRSHSVRKRQAMRVDDPDASNGMRPDYP